MAQSIHGGHLNPLPQPSNNSSSAKLWSVYVQEADRQDRALAHSWKGNMDSLLIFAGLFSACITAFLLESYKSLTPDPNMVLLAQISLNLATIANATQPILPFDPVSFQPSYASLLCNAFWFLSLAFSLACALAATLVDQWTRNYLTMNEKYPAPQTRARVRAFLYQGIQRFSMSTVVETIPALLHISLFLFLAGLIEFLYPVNTVICSLGVAILVICTILYAIVTLLPMYYHHCPYQTPFTSLCWEVLQRIGQFTWFCNSTPQPPRRSLSAAREASAIEKSPARDTRDEEALCSTLESLSEENGFSAFIEGIPGFLVDGSAHIMRQILRDKNINFGPRLVQRLHLSAHGGPSDGVCVTRVVSCLGAIWHILAYCWHHAHTDNDVEEWFDEETLPVLESFMYEGPVIDHYLSSTIALFTSSLLDSYLFSAKSMEQELRYMGIELPWTNPEPRIERLRVERYVINELDVTSGCVMAIKKWLCQLEQDFAAIQARMNSQPLHPPPTDELLQSLWSFQALVNEAQITVYNDHLARSLSDFSPYEEMATFYLLVFHHDLSLPVTLYNQTRLVNFLKRYENMPQVAVDHLLDTVSILEDETLISQSLDIITDYLKACPESNSASKARLLLTERSASQSRPSVLNMF
ncbi:hypothetical protein H0H92_000145 [Tricholoma furcatifolium]|nr:hypothetical protein H0H92_000145 [Tricholoma furcatifolium]